MDSLVKMNEWTEKYTQPAGKTRSRPELATLARHAQMDHLFMVMTPISDVIIIHSRHFNGRSATTMAAATVMVFPLSLNTFQASD